MIPFPAFYVLVSAMIFFIYLPNPSRIEARDGGFTVELIHRDSPFSPFYNSAETQSIRLRKAVHRSISRVGYLRSRSLSSAASSSPKTFVSMVTPSSGEYLIKLSIGTPPFEFFAIVDTGSDLTWTKCKPDNQDYDQSASFFYPQASSSYHDLSCLSRPCQDLHPSSCIYGQACQYSYSYKDNSSIAGALASEKLTFNSVVMENIVFGCAYAYNGVLTNIGAGLIGLGGGPVSLITQLAPSIGGKLSYCLVPLQDSNMGSTISFGNKAMVHSSNSVSTPLVSKEPTTFYFLNLEGLSVNDKKFDAIQTYGNIIIDSGTTYTYLSIDLYSQLELKLVDVINLTRAEDPTRTFRLCYEGNPFIRLPDITFHFTGADLILGSLNTFIETDGLVCLAILPSNDCLSIFGNMAQRNFVVTYDLEERKVLFASTRCSSTSYSDGVLHLHPSVLLLLLSLSIYKLLITSYLPWDVSTSKIIDH
ncbi:PREDICTED: aspartic proteinase CDR1-like [Nelumbo nucifera]|uniref:Peptidase A1 domain-containing protein n=2 Tax=Nelumbo nucifera TaxID=4432 RepID=A0A822YYW8_NELNU|nr:PREDICTED: aspartic proteinase CDR1-like [Nelumbo nucifera]DAD36415.1 TPA_asm: hypothetical protein HUJ06_007056 [Nelumbo nucifera]